MSGYAPREVRKVPNEVPKWPTAVGATRRTAVHHLVLDRSRSSRNRCPIGNAGAAELDTGQSVDLTDTPLEPGVQSADVRVTWHDPETGFEVRTLHIRWLRDRRSATDRCARPARTARRDGLRASNAEPTEDMRLRPRWGQPRVNAA
jgi:hypothetical protein